MAFEDTLARWLPAQRWYAGTAAVSDLSITASTTLAGGDPELRHLIVTAGTNGSRATYQVVTGVRTDVPEPLQPAVIGPAEPGGTAYDALHDPALARILLHSIDHADTIGPLRFAREPGAGIDAGPDGRVFDGEQSNTSLVFGQSAILKVLRRLFPGQNPDLEIPRALARRGCQHVAEPLGWIETWTSSGDTVVLAILSRYLPSAQDGWTLATASIASPAADFTAEAAALGQATAQVHADLAAVFGTADQADGYASLARQMITRLDAALAEVPELAQHAASVREVYARVAALPGPLQVQRVHGDYHLGQVLRTAAGWVILDFEGEPSVPLPQRRARGPVLRDVAGMLRSLDYAAGHQLPGTPQSTRRGGSGADEWLRRCQAAFCDSYTAAAGADPRGDGTMLRALMLDKAVYETVYEARHRPSWLPIPLGSIEKMSEQ